MMNINTNLETYTFDAITFNCYQSIIHNAKARQKLAELWVKSESELLNFGDLIYQHLSEANPYALLDINNPSASIYWTALQMVNYTELAKCLNEYFLNDVLTF